MTLNNPPNSLICKRSRLTVSAQPSEVHPGGKKKKKELITLLKLVTFLALLCLSDERFLIL